VAKFLLLSVVIAIFAIPMVAARDQRPARGLRKVVWLIVAYNLFYLFAVRYIYPHLL